LVIARLHNSRANAKTKLAAASLELKTAETELGRVRRLKYALEDVRVRLKLGRPDDSTPATCRPEDRPVILAACALKPTAQAQLLIRSWFGCQEAAAAVITEPIWEKMVLMLPATLGISAPAATATNPAIRAYSIRSCPRLF